MNSVLTQLTILAVPIADAMFRGVTSRGLELHAHNLHSALRQARTMTPTFTQEISLFVANPVHVQTDEVPAFAQDTERFHDQHHQCLLNCYGYVTCDGDQRFLEQAVVGADSDATEPDRELHDDNFRLFGREATRLATLWEDCGAFQDLHTYARDNRQRSFVVMRDVALGVQHLHANGIAHGNICSTNVVVVDGRGKLANFTIDRRCHNRRSHRPTKIRLSAPEFLAGCGGCGTCASFAADVFQLGLCAVELATGEPAFGTLDDDVVMSIILGRMECPRPRELACGVWIELSRLLAVDPSMRPTIGEAVDMFTRMAGDECH